MLVCPAPGRSFFPDGRSRPGSYDAWEKERYEGGEDVLNAAVQLVVGIVAGVVMFLTLYALGFLP